MARSRPDRHGCFVALPRIAVQAANGDHGTLAMRVAGLPAGAILSDGTHRVTAAADGGTADVTGWNLARLTITLPANCGDDAVVNLTLRATSTDTAGGTSATTERKVTVRTLSGAWCANPVTVNPYVDLSVSAAVTTTTAASTYAASGLVAATGSYQFGVAATQLAASLHASGQESNVSMEAWLPNLGAALDKSFLKEMKQAIGK